MKQVIAYDGVAWPDRPSSTVSLRPTYYERPDKKLSRADKNRTHAFWAFIALIALCCPPIGWVALFPIVSLWSDDITDYSLREKALAIWDEATANGEDADLAVRKFYYRRSYGWSWGNQVADEMAEETTAKLRAEEEQEQRRMAEDEQDRRLNRTRSQAA